MIKRFPWILALCALLLPSVVGAAPAQQNSLPAQILGITWNLIGLRAPGEAASEDTTGSGVTISFEADGRVSGSGGCNGYGGTYTADASSLTISDVISTLRACVDPIGAREGRFFQTLPEVTAYELLPNGQLKLTATGQGELLFEAGPTEAGATVSGTITYRERIALPPSALILVQLQDVSRADAPGIILAEQTLSPNGAAPPYSFSLSYDPSTIDDRLTYIVRAEIRDGNQLLFTTTQQYAVISQGNPTSDIEIVVQSASSGGEASTPTPGSTAPPATAGATPTPAAPGNLPNTSGTGINYLLLAGLAVLLTLSGALIWRKQR